MQYNNQTITYDDYSLFLPEDIFLNINRNNTHNIPYTKCYNEIIINIWFFIFILMIASNLIYSLSMQHKEDTSHNTSSESEMESEMESFTSPSLEDINQSIINKNKKLEHKNKVLIYENIFLCKIIGEIRDILQQDERCARKNTKIKNLLRKYYEEDEE